MVAVRRRGAAWGGVGRREADRAAGEQAEARARPLASQSSLRHRGREFRQTAARTKHHTDSPRIDIACGEW